MMNFSPDRITRFLVGLAPLAFCLLFFAATVRSVEIKNHFAKFGDVKIHYLTRGKGDQALIFVHGWTCNADFWRTQMSDFPSLHLIAVDLVGHGQSGKPRVAYTMDYFARSIEAVMRDAKVKRAVLVGHSMGTPVIRQFYRLYPDKNSGSRDCRWRAEAPVFQRADGAVHGTSKNKLSGGRSQNDRRHARTS
jgi:pimeloyl-ACP methyl ester carboxylesterase